MKIHDMLVVFAVFMALIIGFHLMGGFVYQKESFEATVVEIEPYGSGGIFGGSKVVVRFDDGRVYDLYKIPDGLLIDGSYLMEYREPYFLRSPYLAVVEAK